MIAFAVSSIVAQRPQSEADDPEPEGRHRAEHGERDEQLDEEEAVERVVLAPQRSGDEQELVRMVALDRRAHAIVNAAVERRDREEPDPVALARVRA